MYEKRWLIEEYHKCWKSGCRVDDRPLQSLQNIERFMAISAHIAAQLLQLKMVATKDSKSDREAEISPEEWICLHKNAYPEKPIPEGKPSEMQVYKALAKLGGFLDTKKTGIAGWQTLWKGYNRFEERFSAWKLAKIFYETAGEKM